MRKFICAFLALIIGTAFMAAPSSAQEEEPPPKGGVHDITSCVMLNFTKPYEKEFHTYTVGQPIDLEVVIETEEPFVLTFFVLEGERLNDQSATAIQWVPKESGDFVVTAEFFDHEGNQLSVEEEMCSVTITVIENELGEPAPVVKNDENDLAEPAPVVTNDNPAMEVTPPATEPATADITLQRELPHTGNRTVVLGIMGIMLIGLGLCFRTMFGSKYR